MSDAPKYCLGIVRWVEEPVNAPLLLRALGAVPGTIKVPVACVLAPGHEGACRDEESVLRQLNERPLTVRGL